jgi:SOS-response transcriptional repressor LexA
MDMKNRIAQRMAELDMTQEELSAKVGISQVSIHKILKGGQTRKVVALAEALQCSPAWLETGRDASSSGISPGPALSDRKLPLISFVKAGELCEAEDPYPPGEAERWVDTYINVKEGMYALRVEGDSMASPTGSHSFPEGMIIIVDPTKRAENGKFVIARDGNGKATFKKLSIDGDRSYLVPLNPRYDPIPIKTELHICGVVVAAQFDLT